MDRLSTPKSSPATAPEGPAVLNMLGTQGWHPGASVPQGTAWQLHPRDGLCASPSYAPEYFRTGQLPVHAAKRSLWHVHTASCLHLKYYLIFKKKERNRKQIVFWGTGSIKSRNGSKSNAYSSHAAGLKTLWLCLCVPLPSADMAPICLAPNGEEKCHFLSVYPGAL